MAGYHLITLEINGGDLLSIPVGAIDSVEYKQTSGTLISKTKIEYRAGNYRHEVATSEPYYSLVSRINALLQATAIAQEFITKAGG